MCLRKVLGHDPERHWVHHNRRGTGCALNARVKPSLDSGPEPFGDNDLSAHGFYNARAVKRSRSGPRHASYCGLTCAKRGSTLHRSWINDRFGGSFGSCLHTGG